MSSTTANLGLTLPAGSDWADVAVLNENWEKIDQSVGNLDYDPAGSAADAVQQHNESWDAHPDIRASMLTAQVQVTYNGGGN